MPASSTKDAIPATSRPRLNWTGPARGSVLRAEVRLDPLEDLVTGDDQDQQQIEADPARPAREFPRLADPDRREPGQQPHRVLRHREVQQYFALLPRLRPVDAGGDVRDRKDGQRTDAVAVPEDGVR